MKTLHRFVLFFSLVGFWGAALGHEPRTQTKTFKASVLPKPGDIPRRWKQYIGEYVANRDTVYLLENFGSLQVRRRGTMLNDELTEIKSGKFRIHQPGPFGDSLLLFKNETAEPWFTVRALRYVKIPLGGTNGGTFRIHPRKPYNQLYNDARAATPPVQPDSLLKPELVELKKLDPTVKLDIRYATTNNFMGSKFYSQPRAFLQKPAAEALIRAHRWLNKRGFGLLIHDAYRPWYVTKMFWEATPPEQHNFVADPSRGSRHNRGCAVDLTLYDLKTGKPVDMVSGYDEFSPRAFPNYPGGTSLQRWHRELLHEAMEAEGFQVYEFEWWHFDFKDWQHYPVMNVTFDKIR